jgi:hypothetical protein
MLAGREFVVVKDGNMSVIEVDSTLIQEIGSYSRPENGDLRSVVEDALRQHLFRLRQQKIDTERRYYEAHHGVLVQTYLGQYVAIHEETIVGNGPDGHELAQQMRRKYGRVPIAIIRVEETPEPPTIRVRSPKRAYLASSD